MSRELPHSNSPRPGRTWPTLGREKGVPVALSSQAAGTPSGEGLCTRLVQAPFVKHDGRLDVLCCLVDEGPLSPTEIAVRIGKTSQAVRYWVNLLDSFGLVQLRGELVDGEPQYGALLEDQPAWVRAAVRQHRPGAL